MYCTGKQKLTWHVIHYSRELFLILKKSLQKVLSVWLKLWLHYIFCRLLSIGTRTSYKSNIFQQNLNSKPKKFWSFVNFKKKPVWLLSWMNFYCATFSKPTDICYMFSNFYQMCSSEIVILVLNDKDIPDILRFLNCLMFVDDLKVYGEVQSTFASLNIPRDLMIKIVFS